jgi:hypothetical protein
MCAYLLSIYRSSKVVVQLVYTWGIRERKKEKRDEGMRRREGIYAVQQAKQRKKGTDRNSQPPRLSPPTNAGKQTSGISRRHVCARKGRRASTRVERERQPAPAYYHFLLL